MIVYNLAIQDAVVQGYEYVHSMQQWKDRIIKIAVADDVDLTIPLPSALHVLDPPIMEKAFMYMSGVAVFYCCVCVCVCVCGVS